jgi:hypothetical protein
MRSMLRPACTGTVSDVARERKARQAQQLEPDARLHALRAQVEQALGHLAQRAGQAAQQALAHRRVTGEDGAERFRRHRGEQRFADGDHVSDAPLAVERRVHAHQLAGAEVAEDDLPAAARGRAHAHFPGDHEVHVAFVAIAPHHVLVARDTPPAALPGNLAQRVGVEPFEDVDLLQPEQRRGVERGLGGQVAAADYHGVVGVILPRPLHTRPAAALRRL